MNGFYKWLSSTKFQITLLATLLIYSLTPLFKLSPEVVADSLVKIVGIYCGARILEPIVEFLIKKLDKKK